MAVTFCSHFHRICHSLGLSQFDLSKKELVRIDKTLENIQDSSTIVKSIDDCTSPGHRKISSAIFDMTEYLAQSPPLSPAGSEPDSPRCSLSSCNELSRYSRQISDPESSSSETESDQSDVFTENEVTTYTYTRMFLPFLLLTKSGEIFQHFSFCSLLFICEGEFVLFRCPFSGFKLSVNKNYGSICWVELGSNSQFFVLFLYNISNLLAG